MSVQENISILFTSNPFLRGMSSQGFFFSWLCKDKTPTREMFFTEKISEFVVSKVLRITTWGRKQVSGKSTGRMAKGRDH